MAAETPQAVPKGESENHEAPKPECKGEPAENILIETPLSASALKRKRNEEEIYDWRPTLRTGFLGASGKPPISATFLSDSIGGRGTISTSTSQANTPRNAPLQLSTSATQQTSPHDGGISPNLPSAHGGLLKFDWRPPQTAHTNPGPNLQNPTASFIYPNSQAGPRHVPTIIPGYANHCYAMPLPYLDTFPPTYQQAQQHLIGESVPPYLNTLPVAYQPQTLHPFPPLQQSALMWSPLNFAPPTTQDNLVIRANIPTTVGTGPRFHSKTIERFADILVDLIELHTTKAVSADWASCPSPTKVDQAVQTDIPEEIRTTEAGTHTGEKHRILDIETIQGTSSPESVSGDQRDYKSHAERSEHESARSGHQ